MLSLKESETEETRQERERAGAGGERKEDKRRSGWVDTLTSALGDGDYGRHLGVDGRGVFLRAWGVHRPGDNLHTLPDWLVVVLWEMEGESEGEGE